MAGTLTPGTGNAFRYKGTTNGGPPSSGSFTAGDWVEDANTVWVCVTGGTPGIWVNLGDTVVGSSWDPTAGATSGSDVTTTFQAAVNAAAVLGGDVAFPAGTWTVSSTVTASTPVTIRGPENAVLNFTGTGIGLKMGPDGLVVGTKQDAPYVIRGLTFTGGASLTTAGIRFNKYITTCRVVGSRFNAFCAGASGVYGVELYDENWDARIEGCTWFNGATAMNGINVNAAGGVNSTRLQVLNSAFHSDAVTGTAIRANGRNNDIAHCKIEGFGPAIIQAVLALDLRVHDCYGEVTMASGGGWIKYAETAVVMDGIVVESCFVNLHKSDKSLDVSVLYPGHASAGLKNAILSNNVFVDQGTAPIVVMNTAVAGQVPNTAKDNKGYTGALVTASVTGNGSVWAGTPTGLIVDTRWVAVLGGVGFQNSWVNAGGHPAASYRFTPDGRHVELIGGVNGGVAGTVVFTLPAAYRPLSLQMWTQANASTLVAQVVDVSTAGDVKIFSGAAGNNQRFDGTFAIDI